MKKSEFKALLKEVFKESLKEVLPQILSEINSNDYSKKIVTSQNKTVIPQNKTNVPKNNVSSNIFDNLLQETANNMKYEDAKNFSSDISMNTNSLNNFNPIQFDYTENVDPIEFENVPDYTKLMQVMKDKGQI